MTTTIVIAVSILSLATLAYGIYTDRKADRKAREEANKPAPTPLPETPATGWPELDTKPPLYVDQER